MKKAQVPIANDQPSLALYRLAVGPALAALLLVGCSSAPLITAEPPPVTRRLPTSTAWPMGAAPVEVNLPPASTQPRLRVQPTPTESPTIPAPTDGGVDDSEEASGSPIDDERMNSIDTIERPLISGLWGMKINKTHCIEYYNFSTDGQVRIASAAERTTGLYQYELPDANDTSLPLLTMQIKTDNQKKDCTGKTENQTGEESRLYVKWLAKNQVQFCGTADGQRCELTLSRVLP